MLDRHKVINTCKSFHDLQIHRLSSFQRIAGPRKVSSPSLILLAAHSNRIVVIEDSLPFASHRHYVLSLPESTKAEDVFDRYQRLLAEVKGIQKRFSSGPAYNVALTYDWLCLIPRKSVNRDGIGANAAGMLGLVWLRDQEERDGWSRLGYTSHLEYLGMPMDTSKM